MAGRYTLIELPGFDAEGHIAANGGPKQYRLRLDINAWQDMLDELGVSMEALEHLEASPKVARAMLWAALQHYQPDLSLRQVGALVEPGNLGYVMQTVGQEMARSQEGGQGPNPPKRRSRSTSRPSGGTPTASG